MEQRKKVRKAFNMPPGLANQCSDGLATPLTPWVTVTWAPVYALCIEILALGLGVLALRRMRIIPRGASVSLLLVTACAVGAAAVGLWITNRNLQSCIDIPVFAHATPAIRAQLERAYTEPLTQAHIAFGVNAAMVILGTALTVVTFIRGWRARMRRRIAAPA